MRFSILHLSDLHRDLSDEVDNRNLLDSLRRDFEQYSAQEPNILQPTICIVSGDLVYGVTANAADWTAELQRQSDQAEEFLVGLADSLFGGRRENVVILPGNHDVAFPSVLQSVERIEIPPELTKKEALVRELFERGSRMRWSWSELCFYRIIDETRYEARLSQFAKLYERFYRGSHRFSLDPQSQHDVFDFPSLLFGIITLNSCYENDPWRRAGSFHPRAVGESCNLARDTKRLGWLMAAAWHHSLFGGPTADDYLDIEVLQLLIDAGVSIGFHGHQHMTDCVDEQYRIGPGGRKMTIVSAGTLCAGPRNLTPGVPRSYNVVELDPTALTGRVHQRQMVNRLYNLPVWGPGHFNITNAPHLDFSISKPLGSRPRGLDAQLALDEADKLVGAGRWADAIDLLAPLRDDPSGRPFLLRALTELADSSKILQMLSPPRTSAEAVVVGAAVLESGTREDADLFLRSPIVEGGQDASVNEITRRIRLRSAL
jgi:hypothetical protein